jgi:hypothetical protein
MKKLAVIFAVFVSSFGFGQLVSVEFHPEYGDNPLAQSVPLKKDRIVNMDFIDTLLYKVKDSSRLNDSFIVDIERRYNEVLDGVYSIEILNCYTWNNRVYINVHITDNVFYTPEAFVILAPTGYDGNFDADLYGIEVSYQRETLKEDIADIFTIINMQQKW